MEQQRKKKGKAIKETPSGRKKSIFTSSLKPTALNSPKIVTQSTHIDNLLLEAENNQAKTVLYKLDGFKEYRKQLGLNMIRNKDLVQESG